MRRALLVFNPQATSVSARVRDVIARALASELSLEVAGTKRRSHATHLAAGAAHEGFDLVVVLGGDGTVNEVVNGMIGSEVPIAPLPGGGTNVFSRTLGYPPDPIEATAVLIERLRDATVPHRVNVGRVNGRAFTFCAGVGIDAAVVRDVERRFRMKKRMGQPFFVYTALRSVFLDYPRRDRAITVELEGETLDEVHSLFVCNSTPYTFYGNEPFNLCPDAGLDRDLAALALLSMRTPALLRIVRRAFRGGTHTKLKTVRMFADLASFTVSCMYPMPYQVDGEYAGETDRFEFESARDAITVLA